jgi:hypothetical protein
LSNIFRESEKMLEELGSELSNSIFLEGGPRLEIVYQYCELSIEHGVAILSLLEMKRDISALALFRIQFEAVVRAY